MAAKPVAVLDEWEVKRLGGRIRLEGVAIEHNSPLVPVGQRIVTSALLRIDIEAHSAETNNTFYKLLSPRGRAVGEREH